MTLFAKILAVLNAIAAVAFGALLLLDMNKRQMWAYAVLRHELVLEGLPLNKDSPDPAAARPLIGPEQLDAKTLQKVFEPVGGSPQPSLQEELKRLQAELPGKIGELADEVLEGLKNQKTPQPELERRLI